MTRTGLTYRAIVVRVGWWRRLWRPALLRIEETIELNKPAWILVHVRPWWVMAKDDHDKLRAAVRALLRDLRIGPAELKVMAKGYSPDDPAAPYGPYDDRSADCCAVQISHWTAKALVAANILEGK